MKRIIFVHIGHNGVIGGLPIIDNRNYDALCRGGMEIIRISTDVFPKMTFRDKFTMFYRSIFSKRKRLPIVQYISKIINDEPEKYIVFFSHSTFGLETLQLSRIYPELKIVTFFHNIEVNLAWRELKVGISLQNIKKLIFIPLRECFSAKKSTLNIVLNSRDEDLLKKIYGKHDTLIFPTTLDDKYEAEKKYQRTTNAQLRLIFVGTYFFGNAIGIKKFIREVMPMLENACLIIVGNGMQRLADVMTIPQNVKLIGAVSDSKLSELYHSADIAVLPVFHGGGMKTKTAEAMMYHLPVVGSEEAFCGYEVHGRDIGLVSDDFDDWVQFINRITHDNDRIRKMGDAARQLYLERHETASVSSQFFSAIKNL